jgi:hypothetical protein
MLVGILQRQPDRLPIQLGQLLRKLDQAISQSERNVKVGSLGRSDPL